MADINGVGAAVICVVCFAAILGAYAVGFEFGRGYEARAPDNQISIGRLCIDNFSIDVEFLENSFVHVFLDKFVLENVILRGNV